MCFAGDSGSVQVLKRGDLIELGEDSADMIQSSGWCYGLCVRTGKRVDFPAECVYILPTMTKPPPEILVLDLFQHDKLYILHCFVLSATHADPAMHGPVDEGG